MAFADASERLDLRRPVMKKEPVLRIRKGIHPLYAVNCPTGYIDNDTVLHGGNDSDLSSMVSVGTLF